MEQGVMLGGDGLANGESQELRDITQDSDEGFYLYAGFNLGPYLCCVRYWWVGSITQR